jgi:hypothetical protein
MKTILKYVLVSALSSGLTVLILYPLKEKRLEGYRNAAEWGCLNSLQFAGSFIDDDAQYDEMAEQGLPFCEERGKIFKEFVGQ